MIPGRIYHIMQHAIKKDKLNSIKKATDGFENIVSSVIIRQITRPEKCSEAQINKTINTIFYLIDEQKNKNDNNIFSPSSDASEIDQDLLSKLRNSQIKHDILKIFESEKSSRNVDIQCDFLKKNINFIFEKNIRKLLTDSKKIPTEHLENLTLEHLKKILYLGEKLKDHKNQEEVLKLIQNICKLSSFNNKEEINEILSKCIANDEIKLFSSLQTLLNVGKDQNIITPCLQTLSETKASRSTADDIARIQLLINPKIAIIDSSSSRREFKEFILKFLGESKNPIADMLAIKKFISQKFLEKREQLMQGFTADHKYPLPKIFEDINSEEFEFDPNILSIIESGIKTHLDNIYNFDAVGIEVLSDGVYPTLIRNIDNYFNQTTIAVLNKKGIKVENELTQEICKKIHSTIKNFNPELDPENFIWPSIKSIIEKFPDTDPEQVWKLIGCVFSMPFSLADPLIKKILAHPDTSFDNGKMGVLLSEIRHSPSPKEHLKTLAQRIQTEIPNFSLTSDELISWEASQSDEGATSDAPKITRLGFVSEENFRKDTEKTDYVVTESDFFVGQNLNRDDGFDTRCHLPGIVYKSLTTNERALLEETRGIAWAIPMVFIYKNYTTQISGKMKQAEDLRGKQAAKQKERKSREEKLSQLIKTEVEKQTELSDQQTRQMSLELAQQTYPQLIDYSTEGTSSAITALEQETEALVQAIKSLNQEIEDFNKEIATLEWEAKTLQQKAMALIKQKTKISSSNDTPDDAHTEQKKQERRALFDIAFDFVIERRKAANVLVPTEEETALIRHLIELHYDTL